VEGIKYCVNGGGGMTGEKGKFALAIQPLLLFYYQNSLRG
jgi:hypothetical protein